MDTFILKDSVTGKMSDDEFLKFCLENPGLRIERNSNLEIIIMSPVTSKSSFSSTAVIGQLYSWAIQDKKGFAFDSSAGFTLPDRSVLFPDASWVSKEKWNLLSENEKDRFAPLSPEFIIEVRSKSDSLVDLKEKMRVWIGNGTLLAWLIDPSEKSIYIYRSKIQEPEVRDFANRLKGEGPVEGFVLELSLLEI